jgi:hypothetical protein
MAPWQTDAAFAKAFIGRPHLTETEVAAIAAWPRDGALEGDPRDLPRPPRSIDGWQIGKPDLVVRPPHTRCPQRAPTCSASSSSRCRRAASSRCGGWNSLRANARVVRHANIRSDRTGVSRKYDDADPAPG